MLYILYLTFTIWSSPCELADWYKKLNKEHNLSISELLLSAIMLLSHSQFERTWALSNECLCLSDNGNKTRAVNREQLLTLTLCAFKKTHTHTHTKNNIGAWRAEEYWAEVQSAETVSKVLFAGQNWTKKIGRFVVQSSLPENIKH